MLNNILYQTKYSLKVFANRKFNHRRKFQVDSRLSIAEFGEIGYDTFLGYYDFIPFDEHDEILLATRRHSGYISETSEQEMEIGYYNTKSPYPTFKKFATTNTWCWQMGCRLQWIYGPWKGNVISNELLQEISRPVYSISPDGKSAVSLNFSRLQRLRPGYGYNNYPDQNIGISMPKNDGLWLIDLQNGSSNLLFSLADIRGFEPTDSMHCAEHYFNHIAYSPNSRFIFFIHLWLTQNGKRFGRGLIWDRNLSKLINLHIKKHTSHYCWKDNENIVIYSTHDDTGKFYHLYNINNGKRKILGEKVLKQDGHPSFNPANTSLMVTDTYPDQYSEQNLLLFNYYAESITTIAKVYSPLKFRKDYRCDLHPRWNNLGDKVCIDTAFRGERKIVLLDMNKFLSDSQTR